MDLVPDDLYRRQVGGDVTAQHEAQRARRAAEEAAARADAATRQVDELQAALAAARAESEAAKRCAAAALQAARELDQFACVTAHDLKAPLRGIANLARWIQQDPGNRLTDESAQHLDRLHERVQRLQALIEGILASSRADPLSRPVEPVDTAALVREVIELLAVPEEVELKVPPDLPVLQAERAPLQQVLMNLVANAVKFGQRERHDVRIRLAWRDLGDAVEFAVSDNGPGVPRASQERIWDMFQTLAPRDAGQGSGIGLAVVRNVVQARGGRVALESESGQGATFRFEWPKTAARSEP
jgi:signal transduction histidine kinase